MLLVSAGLRCGGEAVTSGPTGGGRPDQWGCIVVTYGAGGARCQCASPTPEGTAIAASECSALGSGPFVCCSHDATSCECTSGPCPAGSNQIESCEHAYACPLDPLPSDGTACVEPGVECQGTLNGYYCTNWCVCSSSGVFHCEGTMCN